MSEWTNHCILGAREPLVLAHRGGAALWPENTLLAFQKAIDLGCPALELDVFVTSDGKLVVHHDETVERTTNGRGRVDQLSLEELRALDAGYWFTRDGVTFPYRGKGLTVPTFQEVVALGDSVGLNVEVKSRGAGARLLARAIRDHRLEQRVLVAARLHDVIQEFRGWSEGLVPTAASRREIVQWLAMGSLPVLRGRRPSFAALQVPVRVSLLRVLTRARIEQAHARGIKVHAWTINRADEMQRLLRLGVDGIISDQPDVFLSLGAAPSRKPHAA